MKKSLIVVTLLTSILLVASSEVSAVEWKIGVVDPDNYFMTELTAEWAKNISEKTGGSVRSKVFASGQLGGDVDMLEGLQMGTLQVWEGGVTALSAFEPVTEVWALPYIYASDEHRYRFWDKHLEEVSNLVAEKSGYRIVAVLNGPNRQLTATRPVRAIGDLKGMKIRVPEVEPFVKLWRALGAAPVAMPFPEVYTALQTKVVDGQENDVLLSQSSGFFEVAKYLVLTNHIAYDGLIVLEEKYYQGLTGEIKKAVAEASKEIMIKSRSIVAELEGEAIKEVEALGIEVISPDLAPFREKGLEVIKQYPHVEPILSLINGSK